MIPNPWTPSDIAILREGYASGKPVAAIAAAIGRSRGAVLKQAKRLGARHLRPVRPHTASRPDRSDLPRPAPWTDADVVILKALEAQRPALDLSEIAARMGRSYAAVSQKINHIRNCPDWKAPSRRCFAASLAHRFPVPRGMTRAQVRWARQTILDHLGGKAIPQNDIREAELILHLSREPVRRLGPEGTFTRVAA